MGAWMQVTIRGIFLDANPFITSYNAPTQKYHSAYYVANVRPPDACVFGPLWHTVLSSSSDPSATKSKQPPL